MLVVQAHVIRGGAKKNAQDKARRKMQEDLETGRDEPEFGGDSEQNTAAAFYSTGSD